MSAAAAVFGPAARPARCASGPCAAGTACARQVRAQHVAQHRALGAAAACPLAAPQDADPLQQADVPDQAGRARDAAPAEFDGAQQEDAARARLALCLALRGGGSNVDDGSDAEDGAQSQEFGDEEAVCTQAFGDEDGEEEAELGP